MEEKCSRQWEAVAKAWRSGRTFYIGTLLAGAQSETLGRARGQAGTAGREREPASSLRS